MNINEFLDHASWHYYHGTPIMSDEEFDSLSEKHNYSSVGSTTSTRDIEHTFRMYSLQKVLEGELPPTDLLAEQDMVRSPKLDGAAVALTYHKGRFVLALSRGDGRRGRDITNNMQYLVPHVIEDKREFVQITGEVVAPKSLPNARNYAAGALNLEDEEEFLLRDVYFIAYGLSPYHQTHWSSDMIFLNENQFNTVLNKDLEKFPTDGVVWRLDNYEQFDKLGNTSKHPRGAYALKEKPKGVVTKLLDVIWQVGKSGVISPVAILDPVLIGEATISRATLHNMAYIEALELEIGCNVEVIRSGEIIPRIVGRVDSFIESELLPQEI